MFASAWTRTQCRLGYPHDSAHERNLAVGCRMGVLLASSASGEFDGFVSGRDYCSLHSTGPVPAHTEPMEEEDFPGTNIGKADSTHPKDSPDSPNNPNSPNTDGLDGLDDLDGPTLSCLSARPPRQITSWDQSRLRRTVMGRVSR